MLLFDVCKIKEEKALTRPEMLLIGTFAGDSGEGLFGEFANGEEVLMTFWDYGVFANDDVDEDGGSMVASGFGVAGGEVGGDSEEGCGGLAMGSVQEIFSASHDSVE
ncbi:hypothetical protein DITRI_Ditri13aG0026500 [Diplodiscus trichospermus]